jgi:hypothetical protein
MILLLMIAERTLQEEYVQNSAAWVIRKALFKHYSLL